MASIDLTIKGMTCQGCVASVERIIRKKDPSAAINIDLASGRAHVTTDTPADTIAQAITTAGYQTQIV
jgi:copper chaperone